MLGILGRVVEYYDVIVFDARYGGQPVVGQLNPVEVGGDFSAPYFLVCKRDLQQGLRCPGAVMKFTHKHVVARLEGALHGRCGNSVSLHKQRPNDRGHGGGKEDITHEAFKY